MSRSSDRGGSCAFGAALVSVMLAALLGGCMAGPNFVAPADSAPSRFTAAPLTHLQPDPGVPSGEELPADASSAWWSPLGSPRLDATIHEALEHNRDLAAARATLGQMQALGGPEMLSEIDAYPNRRR